MTHISLTLSGVQKHLQQMGYEAHEQTDTRQVLVNLKIGGEEHPLFIKRMEKGDLLQLVTFFPNTFEESAEGDLGQLMHRLNRELELPGLGLDAGSHTYFYRLVIPCMGQQLDTRALESFVHGSEQVAQNFGATLAAVADAKVTYKALLEKMQSQ